MNPLLIALALGGALLYREKSKKATPAIPAAGQSLDPGMDTYTSSVISKALSVETDLAILDTLASDLKAAGFPNSANAIAARSAAIKANVKG